jgi:hypothetical protein
MLALLRFHAVVGARVAVRSFAPLYSAIIAAIMLQMYPAAVVSGYALSLFSGQPAVGPMLYIMLLAFLLPAWAAPRLSLGLNGWLRHLAVSDARNRRGLEISLIIVQMPLMIGIAVLAVVARHQGVSPWKPVLFQLGAILAAGALASLRVRRRLLVLPVSIGAGLAAAVGSWKGAFLSIPALIVCEMIAGPIRPVRRHRRRNVFLSFVFTTAWRALSWRLLFAYASALIPILAALLFVSNNELEDPFAAGAFRLGFALSVSALIAIVSEALAVRRPVWPWARSLPWSCGRRVVQDGLFLGIHAVPVVLLCAVIRPESSLAATALIPLMALRAAASMRRVRERRTGIGSFFAEACFASALLSLVPWIAAPALAAAPLAFRSARRSEQRQKVTRWLEAHHAAAGDSLSWSE